MWQISESIIVNADKATIWKIWCTPQSWPTWDRDVRSCELNGEFKTGTTGVLVPNGGPSVKFTLTEVVPLASFTDIARLPLTQVIFEHVMDEITPGCVQVTHRVKITGLLTWFFSRVMGKQIAKGLPQALRNLATRAESAM